MNHAAIVVLLAVAQASSPVPPKTADHPAHAANRVKDHASSNNVEAAQSHGRVDAPPKTGNGVGTENTPSSISVRELPAVTINTPKKDWADWGIWVFNLLLVVVGGLQVWLLYGTLRAIQRQANQMERQTGKLEESIAVARKAAGAAQSAADAQINAERPWIVAKLTSKSTVMVEEFGIPSGKTEDLPIQISFSLAFKNYGRTPAKIVSVRDIPLVLKQAETLPDTPEYVGGMPSAFLGERMLVPDESWDYWSVPDVAATVTTEQFKDIGNGKQLFVYFGRIEYRDVFRPEIIHETRFSYFYRYKISNFVVEGPSEYTKYT